MCSSRTSKESKLSLRQYGHTRACGVFDNLDPPGDSSATEADRFGVCERDPSLRGDASNMSFPPRTIAEGSRSVVKVMLAAAVWLMRCWQRESVSEKLSGHMGHLSMRAEGSTSMGWGPPRL